MIHIAKGQIRNEEDQILRAKRVVFCDTNLLVIKIWSEHKYGLCDPVILKEIETRKYDLHLLMNIDIPWSNDPQREHPHLRQYFYDLYLKELQDRNLDFIEISGDPKERISSAVSVVKTLI